MGFPPSFDSNNPHMYAGGRMVPTTSWEGMLYGIAQWLDIEDAQMDMVFPNLGNFDLSSLIPATRMFSDLDVGATDNSLSNAGRRRVRKVGLSDGAIAGIALAAAATVVVTAAVFRRRFSS